MLAQKNLVAFSFIETDFVNFPYCSIDKIQQKFHKSLLNLSFFKLCTLNFPQFLLRRNDVTSELQWNFSKKHYITEKWILQLSKFKQNIIPFDLNFIQGWQQMTINCNKTKTRKLDAKRNSKENFNCENFIHFSSFVFFPLLSKAIFFRAEMKSHRRQ